MRLTCPNCGAEYEVPEGMIPPGGKHVQCTNCHTRWFMRGTARPLLSEDQVIQRLETWSPKPRTAPDTPAVVVQMPVAPVKPAKSAPQEFVWETPAKPAPLVADRSTPKARPRLELNPDTAPPPPPPAPPAVRRGFGRGLLVALVPAALAIGVYALRDPIAEQIPAAAPILSTYADKVDAGREWLDDRLVGLREPAQN